MYPDPEAFNPMRWIDSKFPTYKEPLTQYPTIVNMSQFGYGRRTCLGQTVTESDLIAGIGSIAWLFNISKESRKEKVRKLMINEKASISMEELVTGLSDHSSSDGGYDDDEDDIPTVIGAFPQQTAEERKEEFWRAQKEIEERQKSKEEEDPTLCFSKLLIAKPLPFKFELSVRNEKRAEHVETLFREKVSAGEFIAPQQYWGENSGQPSQFGWVPV
jgi:hypothetical protein